MKTQMVSFWFMTAVATVLFGYQNCQQVKFANADMSSTAADSATEVINTLQPTMAVRGMACVQCHANISSNIVTDFGYGSNYFMGQGLPAGFTWKNGSAYGDHGQSFNSITIDSTKTVYVPQATIPASIQADVGSATLAGYVHSQFTATKGAAASTIAATVKEASSVYIGAPTQSSIENAFALTSSQRQKFEPDYKGASTVSGLTDTGTYFKNSGTVTCDGDLVLRGPLYLNNLTVNTNAGCRLYVIGSVFIYGQILYSSGAAAQNLQITSTRSILMGLGEEKKNGAHCEPGSRYATDPTDYNEDTMRNRLVTFWTVPAVPVRGSSDPVAYGTSIMAEAATVAAGEGQLMDASCRAETRMVSYKHLLLNAPIIHSRYTGDIQGTIIAEYALMSLGQFKFEFDSVFTQVDVLPYVSRQSMIDVTL